MSCAVVISSSDGYADAWRPCLALMDKFWPDRPWPRVLVSNERVATLNDCLVIPTGPDEGWGGALAEALARLEDDWVLLLMEDYFALRPWNTLRLQELLVAVATDPDIGYLRLVPTPVPAGVPWVPGVGLHPIEQKYRSSLQAAFWNRVYLMQICWEWPSAWDFETRCQGYDDVAHLSVSDPAATPVHYTIALRKGHVWQQEALDLCRREGIPCPDPL